MKNALNLCLLLALATGLAGCASTPEAKIAKVQQSMFNDFQKMSVNVLEAGGTAVVGIGQSKSLDIALNKAKVNGRVELAQMLETKVEALQKSFIEETGIPPDAEILAQFSSTVQTITSQQIQGSVAKELKYEISGKTITAYALMELDPSIILTQLSKQKELYTRFRATKAFETLDQEIKEYEAFKAAQQLAPME